MAITNYDKCSLLVPFNEADESTSASDYSPVNKTLTFSDNAKVDNAAGYSALKLDGTLDKVTIAAHPDFSFGTGEFLIRFKCKLGSTGIAYGGPLNCYPNGNINGKWEIKSRVASGNGFGFTYYNGSSYVDLNTAFNINDDVEHDIEVTRIGNNLYVFADGDLKVSSAISGSQIIGPVGYDMNIGYNPTDNTYINGLIRDLETYKAVGGHTSGFTAPAAGGLVKTLSNASAANKVLDDTGAAAVRTIRAYPYDWPVRGFETQSDSSGDFSLIVPNLANGFLVTCLDDAAGTAYNALRHSKVVPG